MTNTGTVPCLYVELALLAAAETSDSSPAEAQFHPASFDDNFFTLSAGEKLSVSFRRRVFPKVKDDAADESLQLCAAGWNVQKTCQPMV